tara:strand:+ start:48910 stop:49299 length:390 start_codon:yes stop_codon:yes gene_type:complete
MSEQRIPETPGTNAENASFWEAANQKRFLIGGCTACGEPHFYPRSICPHCFSDATEWRESKGLGTIYSFSIMRRVPVPYAIAYVTLDEGPVIMTNIVDCDLDKIAIDQRVSVVFHEGDKGGAIPVFTCI